MTPYLLNKETTRLRRFKRVQIRPDSKWGIISRVCNRLNVSYLEVSGSSRKSAITPIRFILAHELRKHDITLERIGQIMKRNHATVIYYLNQYEALKSTKDKDFMEMLKRMK